MKETEEHARKEEEARKMEVQRILSQVRIKSGPFVTSMFIIGPSASERETLSKIDWDNPRSQSTSAIKTTETVKEELLITAYF